MKLPKNVNVHSSVYIIASGRCRILRENLRFNAEVFGPAKFPLNTHFDF